MNGMESSNLDWMFGSNIEGMEWNGMEWKGME